MTLLLAIGPLSFAWPWALPALLLVPLTAALLLSLARWRRQAVQRLTGRAATVRASRRARAGKAALLLTGLTLLILAAARPRAGERPVLLPREGSDVMIALDVSASMLATDLQPNRFEQAKRTISQMLDGLQGDRVGLTVFAGNAVLRFPLTTDIEAARALIGSTAIREGNLRPGTGIGEALKIAGSSFGDDAARGKIIVMLSDGEDLAGDPLSQISVPRDREIRVFTVGLGTDQGATLLAPDPRGQRAPQPRVDPTTGQPAVSRANEALLRQIATAGRGRFINGNGDEAAAQLRQEIAALQRSKFASQEGRQPIERFQWFLAAGMLALIAEMLIPERRRRTNSAAAAGQAAARRAA